MSELCDESGHLFSVSIHVQTHLGNVGDITRVDGMNVDDLQLAAVLHGVLW